MALSLEKRLGSNLELALYFFTLLATSLTESEQFPPSPTTPSLTFSPSLFLSLLLRLSHQMENHFH